MLKGLGNLANLGSLVKQAQQMGSKLQDFNQRLKTQRAMGSAGGGLVSVEVDGLGEVISCRIEPSLLVSAASGEDRELLEDLLPAAINQALAKAKELQSQAVQGMAEGFDLSALKGMLNLEPQDPESASKSP